MALCKEVRKIRVHVDGEPSYLGYFPYILLSKRRGSRLAIYADAISYELPVPGTMDEMTAVEVEQMVPVRVRNFTWQR